jgi:capsular polysaccharide biosynthesis protein
VATVRPEELTFVEQVRLFRDADLIVGQHGAGLTNCLFSSGAHVIELHGGYGGGEYYSLCSALGLAYRVVRCEASGDDLVVDVDELATAVADALHDRST